MDHDKTGALIAARRKELALTQAELAERLGVTDKAVSKWERGMGCPDVSLLPGLSELLGIQIGQLLAGDAPPSRPDGGNMKRLRFFVCPQCGGVFTASKNGEIICCGRKLEALTAKAADEGHIPEVEEVEDDWYITFPHPMTKEHHILFAAHLRFDRVTLIRLYPEQDSCIRMPKQYRGELYFCCTEDGLMKVTL